MEEVSEMKVNHWPAYFLQQLNTIYHTQRLCDVTLSFARNQTLAVHRVVLASSTEYFDEVLEEGYRTQQHCIVKMDDSFNFEIVSELIKFMYSGKIEFTEENINDVHQTAMNLRMNLLTSLLDNYLKKDKPKVTLMNNMTRTGVRSPDITSQTAVPLSPVHILPVPAPTPPPPSPAPTQILRPLIKNETTSPKRLNIWKRKPPVGSLIANLRDTGQVRVVLSKPIPTRFEWEGKIHDDFPVLMVGDSMNYMRLDNQLTCKQPLILEPDENMPVDSKSTWEPPAKKMRTPRSDLKEMTIQQQIRNEIMMEELEDDVEPMTPKPILKQSSRCDSFPSKKVTFREVTPDRTLPEPDEPSSDTMEDDPLPNATPPVPSIPMPALTPAVLPKLIPALPPLPPVNINVPAGENTPALRVEVTRRTATSGEMRVTPPGFSQPKRLYYCVLNSDGEEITEGDEQANAIENPVKIITGVLPKNQEFLLGKRKSIRIKVMNSPTTVEGMPPLKKTPGKISFILVKNVEPNEPYDVDPRELDLEWQGPWSCTPCSTLAGKPCKFTNYPDYRSHAIQVHQVPADERVCELCGLRMSTRTTVLHHMLVKHGVPPPRPNMFPSCSACGKVLISANVLKKHIEHAHKTIACTTCNLVFKTSQLLTQHLSTNLHQTRARQLVEYPCPFCPQEFKLKNELKAHIELEHQMPLLKKQGEAPGASTLEEEEEEETVQDEAIETKEEVQSDPPQVSDAPSSADEGETSFSEDVSSQAAYLEETQVEDEASIVQSDCTPVEESISNEYPDEGYPTEQQEEATSPKDTSEPDTVYEERVVFVAEESGFTGEEEAEFKCEEQERQVFPAQEDTEAFAVDQQSSEYPEAEQQRFQDEPEQTQANGSFTEEDGTPSEEMVIDEMTTEEAEKSDESAEQTVAVASSGEYAQYNPVVMFQPNVVMPQRVMLVSHPMAGGVQVLLPHNIISDQLVPISYPQVQVVTTSTGQVMAPSSVVSTDCCQRKVERPELVSDWDENSQTDGQNHTAVPAPPPGTGPSRAEFF